MQTKLSEHLISNCCGGDEGRQNKVITLSVAVVVGIMVDKTK